MRALLGYLLADQDAGSSAEVAQPPGHTAAGPARPAPASAPPLCAGGLRHAGRASSVPPTPTPRPGCLEPAIQTGGELSPPARGGGMTPAPPRLPARGGPPAPPSDSPPANPARPVRPSPETRAPPSASPSPPA